MKKIIALALALTASIHAAAQCVGSGTLKTCIDPGTGNSYNINRLGNTTYMDGSNSRTGSRWNQTSQSIGNTTFNNGRAADGSTWQTTTQRIGDQQFTTGRDSDGNYINCTTTQFGTTCQ